MSDYQLSICFNKTQTSLINELSACEISFSGIIKLVHFLLSDVSATEWKHIETGAVAENVTFEFALPHYDEGFAFQLNIKEEFYNQILTVGKKHKASTPNAAFIFYVDSMHKVVDLWKAGFDLYDSEKDEPVMEPMYRSSYDKFHTDLQEVAV
jgi:hypothetical protein